LAVDYAGDGSNVKIACGPAGGSVFEAFTAAGFKLDSAAYVTSIDGVPAHASDENDPWGMGGYWALYTSTTDGTAAGDPSDNWVFATVGAGDKPVQVDQAYIWRNETTWSCMFAKDPNDPNAAQYAEDDPQGCVVSPALPSLIATPGTTLVEQPATVVPASANAEAAAGWLARQLAANGDVASASGVTDWGLTIDAMIGLVAAGVAGDQVAASAAKLYASDQAYIGAVADISTKWSAIAKTAWALAVIGLDPTAFPTSEGPRNLLADLRSTINTEDSLRNDDGSLNPDYGSFVNAASDNAFSHSLGVLALARTQAGSPDAVNIWLQNQQCSSGTNHGAFGWGDSCQVPDTDTTALAAQALFAAGTTWANPISNLAIQWLETQQDASGGVANSWGTGLNSTTTGLYAQAASGPAKLIRAVDQKSQAVDFLGGLQINCATVAANPATLKTDDLGAVALNADRLADVTGTEGPGDSGADTFRTTTQAVLGMAGVRMDDLSVQGISAATPTASCTPAASPSDDPSTAVDPPAAPAPSNPATTATTPVGSGPGATAHTGGQVAQASLPLTVAALSLLAGCGLVTWAWRRPAQIKD
jgi:hypothetical protein